MKSWEDRSGIIQLIVNFLYFSLLGSSFLRIILRYSFTWRNPNLLSFHFVIVVVLITGITHFPGCGAYTSALLLIEVILTFTHIYTRFQCPSIFITPKVTSFLWHQMSQSSIVAGPQLSMWKWIYRFEFTTSSQGRILYH